MTTCYGPYFFYSNKAIIRSNVVI